MRRREFIGLVGAATAVWPLAARARQPTKLPVIGFFHSDGPGPFSFRITAFRQGLSEAGYTEGQNVEVEYRFAEGHSDRLQAIAAELMERNAAVLCAGNVLAMKAAKAVAGSIPIVFLTASDPVADGFVASFNKPGGNATGIRIFSAGLIAKRLQLLHDLVPAATAVGFLMNPTNPTSATQVKDAETAAAAIGLQIRVAGASDEQDLNAAFETLAEHKVRALVVGADPLLHPARPIHPAGGTVSFAGRV
jgi:putative ABC transport system substrate-binding protein